MSIRKGTARFLTALLFWAITAVPAEAAQVAGKVSVADPEGTPHAHRDLSVVVWLNPLTDPPTPRPIYQNQSPNPKLVQKNKVFLPHVLAVQVGTQVDFPNRDPFFHNVFSLFNGQRFDLGLYEAGSTRSVRFDREGICYILCNIHPQMSAVIVVVDTPYFAISDARGDILIPYVRPGQYQFHLWEEHCARTSLEELSRKVTVREEATSFGTVQLQESGDPVASHLNKYGKHYDPEVFSSPFYVEP